MSPRTSPSHDRGELQPLSGPLQYGSISDTSPDEITNSPTVSDHPSDHNDQEENDEGLPKAAQRPPSFLTASEVRRRVLIKTQGDSFVQDARNFRPGSIPHSLVLAATIGTVCGVAAYLYYAFLFWALDYLWHDVPQALLTRFPAIPASLHVLWIPLVCFAMALGVGLSVKLLGEPGDLPYTIKCVHDKAYVGMSHVLPMVAASQFSILAGGSLGPEAPLVAICASLGGYVSRTVFGVRRRNLVRKHTLMGMAGALSAFFGCPLGGSLFALEVNSRFGIEYFEHTVEAILCGEICLAVFRALARLPIAPIWNISAVKLTDASPLEIGCGALLGMLGALVGCGFAMFHKQVMGAFTRHGLLDNQRAIQRALVGATVVSIAGMLVPHTLFWGEYEFQTIATLGPASELEHVWPTSLLGFEMNSFGTSLIVGVTKLIAISFTVSGGFRGGYIFPAFASGAALGRAVHFLLPGIPVQLCVLCMAAAINVALTRTAIATTLILAYLSGEPNAISSILAASLMSLFLTGYMPFIRSQIVRVDLDHSMYTDDDDLGIVLDDGECDSESAETSSPTVGSLTPFSTSSKTAAPPAVPEKRVTLDV